MFLIILMFLLNMTYAESFKIWIENDLVSFKDQLPVIYDGRTLIPIRTVESLGYTFEWSPINQTVKVISDFNSEMVFTVNQKKVQTDHGELFMDTEARLINGRTMIPLRFVAEGFGLDLNYSNNNGVHEIRIHKGILKGSMFGKGIIIGPTGETDGIFNDQIFRSLIVDPTNSDVVMVGTEANGFFKSFDGGTTWEWYREGLYYFNSDDPNYPEVYNISISPQNPNLIAAAFASSVGPAEGNFPSAIAGFYLSQDGGVTWKRSVKGLTSGSCGAVAFDPNDSNVFVLRRNRGDAFFHNGWLYT